jgi:small subunit ribosomal protein S17
MEQTKTQDKQDGARKGRIFGGVVISTKMKDTAIVEVLRLSRHPLYKKTMKRTKHFAAHVVGMEIHEGDLVEIQETKPISKTKHFIVIGKVTK